MKKSILKILTLAALVLCLLPFSGKKEVRAEAFVNYVFTGLAIPEGQSEVFSVDTNTIEILRANPSLVNVFVAALAEKYNTGVAVIDQNAEVQYLSGVINGTALPGNHIPVYVPVTGVSSVTPAPEPIKLGVGQVLSTPVNMDINSGNYIDVNLTTQTLTLYQNGVAGLAAPVVTGRGNTTPQGLFAVQYKQLNRTLRGDDYEAFVHYWMRIVNNVGIHDASWRGSFGGNIHKTNGSHGCINVPPSLMPSLYAASPVGMPVWVHA